MRILLVEDDEAIAASLDEGLGREGYDVQVVHSAAAALAAEPADLVLLDLSLPDRDGRHLLRDLRAASPVPIIAVTARGDEEDRVAGLNLGADDYVVKPFGLPELVARVKAVMRRTTTTPPDPVPVQVLGELQVDRRARVVTVHGVDVACTPKEYGILEILARDPGALVTRQAVLDAVWGPNWFGTTKMIDVHVASLRKKLGGAAQIGTMRGVGFRLDVCT